jgi:uncharacterized protein
VIAAKAAAWRTARQQAADALVMAAHCDPRGAVRLLAANPTLVERRASWGESVLEAASHLGNQGLAWLCIEAGAPIDLFAACALGDRRLAMVRFDATSADARGVHGLPLLHFAIVGGSIEMLDLLLEKGVAINPPKAPVSPLHTAVAMKPVSVIRKLLDAGADANAPDSMGATPLDWAVDLHGPRSLAARMLVRFGARVEPASVEAPWP